METGLAGDSKVQTELPASRPACLDAGKLLAGQRDLLDSSTKQAENLPGLTVSETEKDQLTHWTSNHIQKRNHFYATTPASALSSGNGFGFAVLAPAGEVNSFYAHPYRFDKPDPDPKKEGHNTTNFLKSLSFEGQKPTDSAGYLNESNILAVKSNSGEAFYFMPFGLARNALIALKTSAAGAELETEAKPCLRSEWRYAIDSEEQKEIDGRSVRFLSFRGVKESVALVPLDTTASFSASKDATETQTNSSSCLAGKSWAILPLENKAELEPAVHELVSWQNNILSSQLPERELKEMESWRVAPSVHFASEEEQKLWRQSETILRMAQSREENTDSRVNKGLILASLPAGEWFIPWVRDMSVSIVGLTEMGHFDEARKGLLAYFNAHPAGKEKQETRDIDYQPSVVRYFGDGSEEADYSGEKTPNVELDDWGLVLWAASEYLQKSGDKTFLNEPTYRGTTVYESMRDQVVEPLLGNLDKYGDGKIVTADSSLWEEHQQNKKHFAFTTIAAIRGLRGFLPIAESMQDRKTVEKVSSAVDSLEKGFASAFIKDGVLRGSVEKSFAHEIDGALTEAFNFDIVNDPKVLENTLAKMELLREPSGGFRRVRGQTEYEKQEFLFVDFNMARLYFKLGKPEEGMKLLDTIVKKANEDHGLIPEMYVSELNDEFPGKIGAPTGAIPMVGYGAGIYAITLGEREKAAAKKAADSDNTKPDSSRNSQ